MKMSGSLGFKVGAFFSALKAFECVEKSRNTRARRKLRGRTSCVLRCLDRGFSRQDALKHFESALSFGGTALVQMCGRQRLFLTSIVYRPA